MEGFSSSLKTNKKPPKTKTKRKDLMQAEMPQTNVPISLERQVDNIISRQIRASEIIRQAFVDITQ